jgi:hypothetical protein
MARFLSNSTCYNSAKATFGTALGTKSSSDYLLNKKVKLLYSCTTLNADRRFDSHDDYLLYDRAELIKTIKKCKSIPKFKKTNLVSGLYPAKKIDSFLDRELMTELVFETNNYLPMLSTNSTLQYVAEPVVESVSETDSYSSELFKKTNLVFGLHPEKNLHSSSTNAGYISNRELIQEISSETNTYWSAVSIDSTLVM